MTANGAGKTVLDMMSAYLSGKTIKAMLAGSSWTFDQDANEFISSVTGEIATAGYTAGGVALTGVSVTQDAATNQVKILANNADFGSIDAAGAVQMVVYIDTGDPATSRIMSRHTFADPGPTASFAYIFPAGVLANFTY